MDVLIIEDDLLFATRLEAIISETAHLFVGHCNSAAEVPHWLTNNSCDVALIDIHLGKGLNGIEISEEFKKLKIPVIFITAFPSEEIYNESLHNDESYFLVKPFDKFTLSSVLDKIDKNRESSSFILKDNNQLIKMEWNNLLYIEVEGNYCVYHFINKRIAIKNSLTKILKENIKNNPLIQINRNFVVNKFKISKINTKESSIEIAGIIIPVGSKYLNEVALNYKFISK
jgi:DNA-binding LytR/AlgR family response regulator